MRYSEQHEWVKLEGGSAVVGITKAAQEEIGEIVYVEFPKITCVAAGDEGLILESTKAAIDLYFPLSGEILAYNEALKEDPSLINRDPEGKGWLYKMKLADPADYEAKLSSQEMNR